MVKPSLRILLLPGQVCEIRYLLAQERRERANRLWFGLSWLVDQQLHTAADIFAYGHAVVAGPPRGGGHAHDLLANSRIITTLLS